MDIKKSGMNPLRHSHKDLHAYSLVEKAFNESGLPLFDKLEAFPRFVTKRSIARFLFKYEIFKEIININGVIIECGVFNGGGLFTWAQLTNIFEPTNYNRKIIGFDTFEGFPSVNNRDLNKELDPQIGDLKGCGIDEFDLSIEKYNYERHLSHIKNIELIKGDFRFTGEAYLKNNPHLLIALLYLDFDIYEPTKKGFRNIFPSNV